MKTFLFAIVGIFVGTFLSISAVSADPYCRKCPFDCTHLGLGKKDCSKLSEASGVCCVDLTEKGLKLAKEQERLLPPVITPMETCPRGFSPSERKCTVEERRKGCKDMRLPNGLGCVHR